MSEIAKHPGRPSTYSPELAEEILERIANGSSLREICVDEHMPDRSTVSRWLLKHEDFATKHAHARTLQADVMDEKILEEAEKTNEENASAQRVKIGAYQWRAERLNPKRFYLGGRMDITSGGEKLPPPAPAVIVDNRMQSLIAIAARRREQGEIIKLEAEPDLDDLMS